MPIWRPGSSCHISQLGTDPWNCSCHRNWRIPSSMEFHGIPWYCSCQRNWRTPSSMEFHGIPWNFSCERNWRTSSSMEFDGTSRVSKIGALQVPWNSMELLVSSKFPSSMEFHGTARVSEIGALQIPWNSMELLMSSKLAHLKFHGITWNRSCQ